MKYYKQKLFLAQSVTIISAFALNTNIHILFRKFFLKLSSSGTKSKVKIIFVLAYSLV